MEPGRVQPEARARAASRGYARAAFAVALLALLSLLTASVGRSLAAAPPPANPVLVVTSTTAANPFGNYLGEVLRAEGFNTYQTADLADVTGPYLASFGLVVLTEVPLTAPQATMFAAYVTGGGQLIAMRPDAQLAPTLGLTRVVGGSTNNGYMLPSPTHPAAVGIAQQTMQIHGVADHYTLSGATSLAALYGTATTPTAFPAVTLRQSGSGWAAAFTYDLARSVAYTRQGNPATAGTDQDGDGVVRTVDGFMGGWLNVDKSQIPQADEQQRLLANLIVHLGQQAIPLPRLWYFPAPAHKSVAVVTGDDHGQQDAAFQNYAARRRGPRRADELLPAPLGPDHGRAGRRACARPATRSACTVYGAPDALSLAAGLRLRLQLVQPGRASASPRGPSATTRSSGRAGPTRPRSPRPRSRACRWR